MAIDLNPLKLIIFDCDGTLTDSELLNNQCLVDVLHKHGFAQYTLEYASEHWGGLTLSYIMNVVAKENNCAVPDGIIREIIDYTTLRQPDFLKAIEGAYEAVEQLSTKYAVCVASNGERGNVLGSLRATGLINFFGEERVFTKDMVARGKPAPDLFLYAAEKMGFMPAQCLVFEDTKAGATAGLAAGMQVVGFTGVSHDGGAAHAALSSIGVKDIFESWGDIMLKFIAE